MSDTPRLRMFAGPNGSGKTTVKDSLPAYLFDLYINPDELEKKSREDGTLPIGHYGFPTDTLELRTLFRESQFLRSAGLSQGTEIVQYRDGLIEWHGLAVNSYHASVLSDFIRRKLLEVAKSFTFETVMSSADKVEFLRTAQKSGYRTYLYYVATVTPEINVSRVRERVSKGGHGVPEEKILKRYSASLALLRDAIRHTHRAYFFDTSGEGSRYIAEITDGDEIDLKTDDIPAWFKTSVVDKF